MVDSADDAAPTKPFGTLDSVLDERMAMFKALLRLDTTGPPGNAVIAADRAAGWLAEAGIESRSSDGAPGRRALVATLRPEKDARSWSAHLDVVPADLAHWTHPPFEAVEADGCIWGRGTIDMKNMAAYGLAIMRQLVRSGTTLLRGLKRVLLVDEEAGCLSGSLALTAQRPDRIQERGARRRCDCLGASAGGLGGQ